MTTTITMTTTELKTHFATDRKIVARIHEIRTNAESLPAQRQAVEMIKASLELAGHRKRMIARLLDELKKRATHPL